MTLTAPARVSKDIVQELGDFGKSLVLHGPEKELALTTGDRVELSFSQRIVAHELALALELGAKGSKTLLNTEARGHLLRGIIAAAKTVD